MRFEPNEDQATFLSVLERMMESDEAGWKTSPEWTRFAWSTGFDQTMEQSGFLRLRR